MPSLSSIPFLCLSCALVAVHEVAVPWLSSCKSSSSCTSTRHHERGKMPSAYKATSSGDIPIIISNTSPDPLNSPSSPVNRAPTSSKIQHRIRALSSQQQQQQQRQQCATLLFSLRPLPGAWLLCHTWRSEHSSPVFTRRPRLKQSLSSSRSPALDHLLSRVSSLREPQHQSA